MIAIDPLVKEKGCKMLLIERELETSQEFYYVKYDGVDLPRLSLRNVALAEAMVANNSSYMLSKSKGGVSRAGAGSVFWLDLMREFQKEGEDPSGFYLPTGRRRHRKGDRQREFNASEGGWRGARRTLPLALKA